MDGHGAGIELRDLTKIFRKDWREVVAVESLTFRVEPEEFVCMLGPSGCGKTTVLRMVAGLERPTRGSVFIDQKEVNSPSPEVGMVFQEFALFPWRTVRKNIAFGLEIKRSRPRRSLC